jgi:phage-related protein
MSKPLSIASVIEKNKIASDVAYVPLLDIEVVDPATSVLVEVLHIARNPEAVTHDGEEYEAGNFDIELRSDAGTQPTINLTIADMTRAVQAKMQEYGGGIGFNVTIKIVRSDALSQPPEVVEYFQVIGASATNYVASFTLGAENAITRTFPRRRQTKDFCQWRYKDPLTCKYAGVLTTCDLTLQGPNGCATHLNTINFGAYPGINRNGIRYG